MQHCVIAATAALTYIIRNIVDRYRKKNLKIFDRRASNHDYSKPDGWSTTTSTTFVDTNKITTTIGTKNCETNNCIVFGDRHGRSVIGEDLPTIATVVVVDMENDDGQEESSTVDAYHQFAIRPEVVKTS